MIGTTIPAIEAAAGDVMMTVGKMTAAGMMTVGEETMTVGEMTAADMMIVAVVIGVGTMTAIGVETIVVVVVGMTGVETISGNQGGGKTTASVTVIVGEHLY